MENSKNNQHSATINEVLSAVNSLAGKNEKQFQEVREAISKNEKQIEDVLEAVNYFADETRQEFINVRQEMATKQDLANLESKVVNLESKVVNLESKVINIESGMVTADKMDLMESRLATRFVTKSYLDVKLADQTSEIFLRLDRWRNKGRSFKEKLASV